MSSDIEKGVITGCGIARRLHFRWGEGGMKSGAGVAGDIFERKWRGDGGVKAVSTSMRRAERGRIIKQMVSGTINKIKQGNKKGSQEWMNGRSGADLNELSEIWFGRG